MAIDMSLVLGFVNLIAIIFFIAGMFDLLKLFGSMLGGGASAAVSAKEKASEILESVGKTEEEKAAAKLEKEEKWKEAKRLQTRQLLNEFVAEERGDKQLKDTEKKISRAITDVSAIASPTASGIGYRQMGKDTIEVLQNSLNEFLSSLGKSYNLLKGYGYVSRRTYRQETRIKKILDALKKKGEDVTQILALERDILAKHKEIADDLKKVYDYSTRMNDRVIELGNNTKNDMRRLRTDTVDIKPESVFGPTENKKVLHNKDRLIIMIRELRRIGAAIQNYTKEEEEVIKMIKGLIVTLRDSI